MILYKLFTNNIGNLIEKNKYDIMKKNYHLNKKLQNCERNQPMKANIYDFDGTIYDGDSSVDFFIFCFKKKKSICRCFPKMFWYLILYALSIKTKTEMKEVFFSFLKYFDKTEELVDEFWDKNYYKIKKWYLENNSKNDIIISASPNFLLSKICKKMKIKELIATDVDIKTGKFNTLNCYADEKVKRLFIKYPNIEIQEMYTDSTSDLPLINLSVSGYIVKKDKIIKYEAYRPSLINKIKHLFIKPKFIRFLMIGIINMIILILFTFLFSNIDKKLSFVIGYITNLFISYILHSYLTFNNKLSIDKFISFFIANIPNFVINLVCLYIFIDIFHLYKLVSYIIAFIIGLPITYILLNTFTFKKRG